MARSKSATVPAAILALAAALGWVAAAPARALAQVQAPAPSCGPNEVFVTERRACLCRDGLERAGVDCIRRETPGRAPPPAAKGAPGPGTAPPPADRSQRACLPADLKDLILRAQGKRREIETCELPCLVRPPALDLEDARRIERRHAIQWCRGCVPVTTFMPLEDIRRIEAAGNVTLCPRPARPEPRVSVGGIVKDELKGVRALFGKGRPAPLHDHVALVIGNARHGGRIGTKAAASRDAATIAVLLTERLGYKPANVIEVRDATRADLMGLFGEGAAEKGELRERVQRTPGAGLFVYVSGQGLIPGEDDGPYLLTQQSGTGRLADTAVPLDRLYQSAAEARASFALIILEVGFDRDPAAPLSALNLPQSEVSTMPGPGRRGLVVMTAAERDQRPLEDYETGLSLFTRHLVEALGGAADQAPSGNGDGAIDSAEAFVFAAARTNVVARKVYGVLQRPQLSQGRSVALPGALGRP